MYTSSISIDAVIDALAAFLQPFVGDSEIIRAQVNRVPMPLSPCVVLTELLEVDLAIPYTLYGDDIGILNGRSRIDVQVDFYGDSSAEFCQTVKTAFRTNWGFNHFPENIRPLYTSDGVQSPLITGEMQYQSRWTLTVSMQYNPTVDVPQDFADTLQPNETIAVDVNY